MKFKNIFNSIPARKPKRNIFDLSHDVKMSMNAGDLVPILCEDCVPGDEFRINTMSFVRMAPMLAPIMHRLNVYVHYFFVPYRLVWNEWEDFITGGPDGSAEPVFPSVQTRNMSFFRPGTLADFLGVGISGDGSNIPSSAPPIRVSILPLRAYQTIYNEYYRDQNLSDPVEFSLDSGIVSPASGSPAEQEMLRLTAIRRRAWEKDYFTSALPWTQRGPEVRFPLSGNAPVVLSDSAATGNSAVLQATNSGVWPSSTSLQADVTGDPRRAVPTSSSGTNWTLDPNGTLDVDMSKVSGTSVNDFRRSIRLQEWLEKNGRGGGRYFEQVLSHFGVRSPDARLNRPEFLGGGKQPISVSEVLQTSSTDDSSPQANMAGHGITAGSASVGRYFCQEHGMIIGIASILPRTAYQQGIPRKYSKFDRFDFYFPEFAHIGEQPIYKKEIYFDTSGAGDYDSVFGYTPRYAEYKHCQSRVAGDFKTSLNFWHMGRIFDSSPALNADFVEADNIERIFAVSDGGATHKYWCMFAHDIRARRPMPKFGVPTI